MKKFLQLLMVVILLAACTPRAQGDNPSITALEEGGQYNCQKIEDDLGFTIRCDLVVEEETPTEAPTETAVVPTEVPPTQTVVVPTDTLAPPATETAEMAATLTQTALAPTVTRTPTRTPTQPTSTLPPQGNIAPFPNAPLCPDHSSEHDPNKFHTLWDSTRGCHYDHEHGQNPFTPAIAAAFPGFDLRALLCGNEISHCNPSSPMENVMKHGGHKWQVSAAAPQGCTTGFEGGTVAVDAYAIQYHAHGRQDIEHEVRNHSSVVLLRQCKSSNPSDKGYIFVGQLQEYGQRTTPYQGYILNYPDNFLPTWPSERGPYFTAPCVGPNIPMPAGMSDLGTTTAVCRPSLSDVIANNRNADSKWTSKPTGSGHTQPGARPLTPKLFKLLFNIRDTYQLLDSRDLVHPFTWLFICSSDGGQTYDPSMPGCRWNNTSGTITEIAGTIPAAWDNLAGWDTDSRVGRITAQGFVTRYGDRNPACTAAVGLDCQPIKMVGAFVGVYTSELSAQKVSNPTPANTFERDIYFCNGVPCSEANPANPNQINPNAIPSGWISSEN